MNKYFKTLVRSSFLALLFSVPLLLGHSFASSSDVSGSIIQSYNADPSVLTGMIVGFKDKTHSIVMPLSSLASRNMLGAVVPASNATLSLTPESDSSQQVLIATAGTYDVLVSNQNGGIKSGDYLTISALDGIAMKSSSDTQEVIGRSAGSFDGSKGVIDTVPIKSALGHVSTVALGRVPVDLRLSPNPLYVKSSTLPGIVTKTAIAIAGKSVSIGQIYLCMTLLVLTFFVTGVIYYSAVRNGIISIGRNPLSKKSVIAGLLKVLVVGLIIFAAGVFAAFLVLKS
jgi:hypothetical protein